MECTSVHPKLLIYIDSSLGFPLLPAYIGFTLEEEDIKNHNWINSRIIKTLIEIFKTVLGQKNRGEFETIIIPTNVNISSLTAKNSSDAIHGSLWVSFIHSWGIKKQRKMSNARKF